MGASDDDNNDEETIHIDVLDFPSRSLKVQVPASDIDACVGFSRLRCVLSTLSLLLALTDVPRTGLGLNSLKDYFEVVGLDTVIYFGPFAYPVAHFHKSPGVNDTSSVYEATCGGERMEEVDAWAYKFDTVSIPTRALAEYLNVTAYPRCVLYLEPCTQDVLSLGSAFLMLDELITSFTARYVTSAAAESSGFAHIPLKFVTESRWIDRLHHLLVKPLGDQTELRTHFVQYFGVKSHQLRSSICDPETLNDVQSLGARPLVCDLVVVWNCDHPELGVGTQVKIWDHVVLRIAALRRQYPDLELDITMITSRMVLRGHEWIFIPAVSFSTDTLEISTLIRGRNCSSSVSEPAAGRCETVFVDDYRYERATFVSDTEQWWLIAACFRGLGQLFVWIRFTLLWLGCYSARTAEKKLRFASWRTKLFVTWLTITKIPSHVLIYGSWFPVCCYVFAHYIDCALIHLISNTAWSTINGVVRFEPVKYVQIASIQMRNLWLVALVVKLLMAGFQWCSQPRQRPWTRRHGVIGIRAILFGTISSLTVFSCLRARGFRDSSIVKVTMLSEQIPLRGSLAFGLDNTTEFGFRFDLKTLAIAASIVLMLTPIAQVVVAFLTDERCLMLTCHSYYVPHSAESLWSSGSLLVYWRMRLSDNHHHQQSSPRRQPNSNRFSALFSNRVLPVAAALTQQQKATESCCRVCTSRQQQLPSRWHAVQGCPGHNSLIDIASRNQRHWSAVRLMNLAMLTDPLVLAWIYLGGQQVFIYAIKAPGQVVISHPVDQQGEDQDTQARQSSAVEPDRLYVLPYMLAEWGSDGDENVRSGGYELVGSTNAARLPWTVLMSCG